MIIVGACQAKAELSALLDRVAAGEEVLITEYGKPIARLVPAIGNDQARARNGFAKLKDLRKGTTLGDLSSKEFGNVGWP